MSSSALLQNLETVAKEALSAVERAGTTEGLEEIRVGILGKKGKLSEVLRGLGSADPADRPKIGSVANEWKAKLEAAIEAKRASLGDAELGKRLASEKIDVTAPSRSPHLGALHPITLTTRKIIDVFSRIGFTVTTGPEAETDFLCFEAANIPADHPARDMQDTFFLGPGVVLRTHTTPVQMRTMLATKPPVRILCPGAVYRCDSDATHSPMFHQIEGLWVDRGVKMSDLKGVLEYFARELFGSDTKIRLRPSYFPFVEPGAEVDVSFKHSKTGWLEILGAGMVHPRLFETAGYSASDLSGFAFGMGIDRIAMILHGIPDLRTLFGGEPRVLNPWASR